MQPNSQLAWIQHNRTRKDRTQHIGAAVQHLAETLLQDSGTAVVRHIAESLTAVVDEQFRQHCRLSMTDGRYLLVSVDDPGLVYLFRQRWSMQLRSLLRRTPHRPPVREVAFEYGTTGISLGEQSVHSIRRTK